MRIHIDLDEDLVSELDLVAGERGRTAFVRSAIRASLDQQKRIKSLRSAIGSVHDDGHDWGPDPAKWVHDQRFGDQTRVG